MNNSLNEYLRFNFELNIELNHFLARFNVKMNNQNVSPTPRLESSGVYICQSEISVLSFVPPMQCWNKTMHCVSCCS